MDPSYRVAFSAAFRVLRNRLDAEDAAQEAMAAFLRTPPESNPDAWLQRIARNKAVDIKRRTDIRCALRAGPSLLAPQSEQAELRDEVRSLLRSLLAQPEPGPRYARALHRWYLQGKPVPKQVLLRARDAARRIGGAR